MPDPDAAHERTALLLHVANERRLSSLQREDAQSTLPSHVSKEEQALGDSTIGERLPYNDYSTIDWLHDLVQLTPSPPRKL